MSYHQILKYVDSSLVWSTEKGLSLPMNFFDTLVSYRQYDHSQKLGESMEYRWFDIKGRTHRDEDLPSYINVSRDKTIRRIEYHRNGKIHRNGDKFASVSISNGRIEYEWYKSGKIQRKKGPSLIVYDIPTRITVMANFTDQNIDKIYNVTMYDHISSYIYQISTKFSDSLDKPSIIYYNKISNSFTFVYHVSRDNVNLLYHTCINERDYIETMELVKNTLKDLKIL